MSPSPELAPDLTVTSRSGTYTIRFLDVIDARAWSALGSHVVCDDYFSARAERAGLRFVPVAATEQAKTLEAMSALVLELRDRGVNRQAHLVALGGGVVQDVVTFAASVYMRGLGWTYVPTTLMAMADSCIGGKSSINVGSFKNLVGTFHPPRAVVIDPAFVSTLSHAEICSGLAEAAKIAFCRGPVAFARYLALAAPVLDGDLASARLGPLLRHVLATKIWFIEKDEFDRAERRLLNFGHTWGHALEASSDYAVPHGLAVALGMLAADAYMRNTCASSAQLVEHCQRLLRAAAPRPLVTTVDSARFREAFGADKKHRTDTFQVIVPGEGASGDGLGVREISIAREPKTEEALQSALERAIGMAW